MAERRPRIPRELVREVLVEAGHRCAIPTCRGVPTEIAHIDPWSKVQEHTFENLITLCANCHSRYDRGEIDRKAMRMYKHNLGLISGRYGETERRLLDLFVRNPTRTSETFPHSMDFEFMYLLEDGVLEPHHSRGGSGRGASGFLGRFPGMNSRRPALDSSSGCDVAPTWTS